MIYDIRDTDLTRSLPLPLKNDATEFAIAKAVAEQLAITANLAEKAVLYARIDELDENILDTLAVDMHVDWYYPDADITAKRKLIKDSVKVHKKLGTPWAAEQVIQAYYPGGFIREWFEYGGEPGYFRIIINGAIPSWDVISRFIKLLEKVKRKTAWLEEITLTYELSVDNYVGLALNALERQTLAFEANGAGEAAGMFEGLAMNAMSRETLTFDANGENEAAGMFEGLALNAVTRETLTFEAAENEATKNFVGAGLMTLERITLTFEADNAPMAAACAAGLAVNIMQRSVI